MSYEELGHKLELSEEQTERLNTPVWQRVRVTETHPKHDKDLYGNLDSDRRPLEEYRHSFSETFASKIYWRIWKQSDKLFMMVAVVGLAAAVAGGLIFGHSWLSERETGNIPVLSQVLEQLFGLPVVVTICYSSLMVIGAFAFRWKMDYDSIMTVCYIIEGHKRVIEVHYPSVMLLGRADQLTSGEFVMVLPPCCDDANECLHEINMIFERDMEKALPAASSIGLDVAARKFELAVRAQQTGEQFSPLPVRTNAILQKYMPYGIMHLVAIGAAVVLFSLEDPTPNDGSGGPAQPPVVAGQSAPPTPTPRPLLIGPEATETTDAEPVAEPTSIAVVPNGEPTPSLGEGEVLPSPTPLVSEFMVQPTTPPMSPTPTPTPTPVALSPVALPTEAPPTGVAETTPEPTG